MRFSEEWPVEVLSCSGLEVPRKQFLFSSRDVRCSRRLFLLPSEAVPKQVPARQFWTLSHSAHYYLLLQGLLTVVELLHLHLLWHIAWGYQVAEGSVHWDHIRCLIPPLSGRCCAKNETYKVMAFWARHQKTKLRYSLENPQNFPTNLHISFYFMRNDLQCFP